MYCHNGKTGMPADHEATGWLISPNGNRVVSMCETHADLVIAEYRDTLGENWRFAPNLNPPPVCTAQWSDADWESWYEKGSSP